MDRRSFIKVLGAGGAALAARPASANRSTGAVATEFSGILIDTVRCVGCRTCEESCAKANGLPVPDLNGDSVMKHERRTSPTQFSVVNRFTSGKDEIHVKRQCMHCNQPACASACLVKAMHKTPEGPVIWDGSKCMGCRFCMLSCPFEIPKFEYASANPRVRKCIMCYPRLQQGKLPACVETCPEEALVFGKRRELLAEARKRIATNPGKYFNHIYGETEAGGTGMLYLSAVPFEKLGFRGDLGTSSYPELTKNFLYSVPVVFTLLPPFLLSLRNAIGRDDHHDDEDA